MRKARPLNVPVARCLGRALLAALAIVVLCADVHASVPGAAWAWGANFDGRLGNGTTTSSDGPVSVTGITDAVAVAGGAQHSLAVKSNGTVWAWGYNGYG